MNGFSTDGSDSDTRSGDARGGLRPVDRPLRIAMVGTPWYEMPPVGYGGIEAMAADLIEGLLERGHEVTAFGAGPNKTGAAWHCTYEDPQGHRVGERWPELVHATSVERILDEGDFDIVHDHSAAGPMLARHRSCPTVVTTHGPVDGAAGTDNGDIGRYYQQLSGDVHFVAISDAQQRLRPQLSWAGTVHNAIRVEDFPFVEQKEDFLLFLGRFKSYKGAHLAIDAARALGKRIVLAGKCAENEEHEYFAAEITPRLGDGVEYLGEIEPDHKLELLSRASAMMFPITWPEPFGMVMIEAMACGTPVVALRHGSVPEVIADGVSGIIRDSADELVEAVQAAQQLSPRACRDHVERNFDRNAMARGYERIYHKLITEHRAGIAARGGPALRLSTSLLDSADGAEPATRTA